MTLVSGSHIQDSAIAAYQPPLRDPYGRDNGNDEISRLREENRQLKAAALREPHSHRIRNAEPSNVTRLSQDLSKAISDIKRMQSGMDGFMRTYASKNARQDHQPARNRYSRPTCEICGKHGHATQHCFHRLQHNPSSSQPQTTWDKNETVPHEPRIAAI